MNTTTIGDAMDRATHVLTWCPAYLLGDANVGWHLFALTSDEVAWEPAEELKCHAPRDATSADLTGWVLGKLGGTVTLTPGTVECTPRKPRLSLRRRPSEPLFWVCRTEAVAR